MRKLGIYFITLTLILCTTSIYAQIRIGAKAGLNIANMKIKDFDDTKSKLGIHLGVVGEYEIADALTAHAGLLLSQKGYKAEDSESEFGFTYSSETKVSMFYLDIPLTAMYKLEVGDLSIYGTGGFNIGMGLSGKYESEYTATFDGDTETDSDSDDIEWGGDNGMKRMDLGFILGAGVEINESIQVGLSYTIGLNNLSPVSGEEYKNRVFALTATYFFTDF